MRETTRRNTSGSSLGPLGHTSAAATSTAPTTAYLRASDQDHTGTKRHSRSTPAHDMTADVIEDDGSLSSLRFSIHGLEEAISFASRAVEASLGGGSSDAAMSTATKRRAVQRAGRSLADATSKLELLRVGVRQLQAHAESADERAESSEESAAEATTRLKQALEAFEHANVRLTAVGEKNDEMGDRLVMLESENGMLKERLKSTVESLDDTREKHAELQSQFKMVKSTSELHKAAVAKLTADNMLFVTRCQAYDEDLAVASKHIEALQEAAEKSQGNWFEKMREQVEKRVAEYMEQVDAKKKAANDLMAEADQKVNQVTVELDIVKEEARANAEEVKRLSEELEQATTSYGEMREELEFAKNELEGTRERVKSLQAEVNVLTMAMSDTRDHVAMYQKERDEAMQRESVLLQKVEHMNAVISKAQKEVYDAKHNLAAQKRVNEALMKKKEEMEWQYLGVLAGINSSSNMEASPLCDTSDENVGTMQTEVIQSLNRGTTIKDESRTNITDSERDSHDATISASNMHPQTEMENLTTASNMESETIIVDHNNRTIENEDVHAQALIIDSSSETTRKPNPNRISGHIETTAAPVVKSVEAEHVTQAVDEIAPTFESNGVVFMNNLRPV